MEGLKMKNEETITIPLWEYKFLNQLKEELIIDMKIEELRREENIKFYFNQISLTHIYDRPVTRSLFMGENSDIDDR